MYIKHQYIDSVPSRILHDEIKLENLFLSFSLTVSLSCNSVENVIDKNIVIQVWLQQNILDSDELRLIMN